MKWWQQLDPKTRKLVLAGGAGLALAVVVMAARGRQPAAPAPGETGTVPAGVDPYSYVDPAMTGPSSFADNGAGFGQLSTALTDFGTQVGGSLDQVNNRLDEQGGKIADIPAAIAAAVAALQPVAASPAQLGNTGRPAAAPPKPAPAPKPKTFAGHPLSWWQNPANAKRKGKWAWPSRPGVYVHSRAFAGN